jgi:hypothetical protein
MYTGSETETLQAGAGFTPSHENHLPSIGYTYDSVVVTYNGSVVENGTMMTCPSTDFTLVYKFYYQEEATLWSWNVSNGEATAAQTKTAYTAITNQGSVSDFSYKVWNDMVTFMNYALSYFNLSWNSQYATLAKTKMTSSDRVLTAVRMNSLQRNMRQANSLTPLVVPIVSTGDPVNGVYFSWIMSAINYRLNANELC